MFSSTSFAEEKFVCNGWIYGDKSGDPSYKFNLKTGRDWIEVIKDRDRPESGMKWKLIHTDEDKRISMYTSYTSTGIHIEYISLIRKKGTKDLELHKWNINSLPTIETSYVRKDFGVEHESGLRFTQCYSF